jgi:peroxiredoxin
LAEYARADAEIGALGAGIAALSVDSPERSEAVRRELGLRFPILSDARREVVRAWDLYNPEEMGGIAFPAVFVIGRDLRVRWRSVDRTARRVATAGVIAYLRDGTPPGERVRVCAGLREFVRAFANAIRRGPRTPEP